MGYIENIDKIKIKSINGEFKDFAGIAKIGDASKTLDVFFGNGSKVCCTYDHKFITSDGPTELSQLSIGDEVITDDCSPTMIVDIKRGIVQPVYDIIEVEDGHQFSVNNIMSSNCSFVTDEETLIDPMCLSRLRSLQPQYYTQQVRWFLEPQPNHSYLVSLDPSLGTGGDNAAIQVFLMPELIQVAEWSHNKTDCRGQVRVMLQILHTLKEELMDMPDQDGEPDIYWSFENNSIAEAILVIIEDTGLEKFPGVLVNERRRRGQRRTVRKGLNTTNSKKITSCTRLKSLIESDRMVVHSEQAIKELKGYIAKGASYAGKGGQTDDLVSALLLITRMLDIVISMGLETVDDLNEAISDDDIWNQGAVVVV